MIEMFLDVPPWVWLTHLLLYPVYQIIGTLKHEAAHALGATIEGRKIERFVFWPQRELGYFTWGYVRYEFNTAPIPRYVHLMPYYVDVAWCLVGVTIAAMIDWENVSSLWRIGTVVLVILLPLVDLVWNLGKWFMGFGGDFARAFGRCERR